MPYIKKHRREDIDTLADGPNTPGELNYAITKLIHLYLEDHGLCYENINDILGALEGCKLEFYRRIVSRYEDKKIHDNGDVIPDFS